MINLNFDAESQARRDNQRALGHGIRRKFRYWLSRGCNDLISTGEILSYLKHQPRAEPALMVVPLVQIVGSSGRYMDFDLVFNPRRKSSENRWVYVAVAKYQGKKLPPVRLYKVGEAYFVEDGNHRVSIARANGEETIDATVIEFDVSMLWPEPKCSRLSYKLGKN